MHRDPAIRLVACFEAAKGLLVLLAATGLLSLLHKDATAVAASLHDPQIFLDAAAHLDDHRLLMLVNVGIVGLMVRAMRKRSAPSPSPSGRGQG